MRREGNCGREIQPDIIGSQLKSVPSMLSGVYFMPCSCLNPSCGAFIHSKDILHNEDELNSENSES